MGGAGIGLSEHAVYTPVLLVCVDPVHARVTEPPAEKEVVCVAAEVYSPLRLAVPAHALHPTVWHFWEVQNVAAQAGMGGA